MLVKVTLEIEGRQAGLIECELSGSASEVEEQARVVTQRVGKILLETAFLKLSAQVPRPHCCGKRMGSAGRRLMTTQTTFGPVIVSRQRCRCRDCGREASPADALWCCGPHRFTRPLAKRVCQLATVEHFTRLPGLLADQHGLTLGHEALLQLVHDIGGVAESQRLATAQGVVRRAPDAAKTIVPEVRPQRICVSCDGIMYCTNQREVVPGKPDPHRLIWQQMKVGCVSWQDAQGDWQKQIIWGRESPEEFGAALFELACRCGYQQAAEKLFSADGGPWCWDIRGLYFSEAHGILDWYHASEHVWEAARQAGRDASQIQTWGQTALGQLRFEGGAGLVAWLEPELRSRRGGPRAAVQALLDDVRPRTELMDYAYYRSRGWPIGTGMMESTCKQLVGIRLKGPGMHWTEAGALAVTALRATDLNHKWNSFWENLTLAV